MRKLIRTSLTAAVLAGTALSLTTTPASAATWNVQNGGARTFHNTINLIAEDIETGAVVACNNSTGGATLDNGVSDNAPLATVDSIEFHHTDNVGGECNGPGGLLVEIQAVGLKWNLIGETYDAVNGVTHGRIEGVKAHIVGSDGCEADIAGPGGIGGVINGRYTNSTGKLNLSARTDNNLQVVSDNGLCDPLLINVGDHIGLDGEYIIDTPPAFPIITMS
ncbi:hypothetical protein ACH35V_07580 [Actinomadura sp. 1N219]|uniref:hypothetical protein n=1 Tax=Actinomadura sp. 1N219 TaxID=3375152 RepID=UPI0037BA086E